MRKRGNTRCELHTGDVRMQQVWKSKYLSSVLTNDAKCDTQVSRHIGRMKDAFPNLNKLLKDRKLIMKAKQKSVGQFNHKKKKKNL